MTTDRGNSAEIAAWNGPPRPHLGGFAGGVRRCTGAGWRSGSSARADVRAGERVIDVGCGAGATTVALGKLVGPIGSVIGVDVSGPLLARAHERLPLRDCRSRSSRLMQQRMAFLPVSSISSSPASV